jgi:uncharacterized lipoprotein YmbA
VRRATAERLELGGDERWAAPLDEMVGAALAENLAQRLPNCVVFSDSGAISAAPDVRVEVQFFRFELTPNGKVTLSAEVAVHSTGAQPPILERFSLSKEPSSGRTSEIVESSSHLLAQLADGIAPLILRQSESQAASQRTASDPSDEGMQPSRAVRGR